METTEVNQQSSSDKSEEGLPISEASNSEQTVSDTSPTNETPHPATESARAVTFDEIRRALQQYFIAPDLADEWEFLHNVDRRFQLDVQPSEFVAAFQRDFGDDLLLQARFLENDNGIARVAHDIDQQHLFVEFNAAENKIRFTSGPVSECTSDRTALSCAFEKQNNDSLASPRTLFVVDNSDDVALLAALGLNAVTNDGLQLITHADVAPLFAGTVETDRSWRFYLVLFDFQLAALNFNRTSSVTLVVRRFDEAAKQYKIDPCRRLGVCRPTAEEINHLMRCVSFCDAGQIRSLLQCWANDKERVRKKNWNAKSEVEQITFAAAREELERAIETADVFFRQRRVSSALSTYKLATSESILREFRETFTSLASPLARVNLLAAEQYLSEYFANDPLIIAAEHACTDAPQPPLREFYAKTFDRRHQSLTQLRRLSHGSNKAR